MSQQVKPIDPQEWRKRAEGELSSVIERAVAKVNEILMSAKDPRPRMIPSSSIGDFATAKLVAEEFRKVGWTVDFTDDQREGGCYYTFAAPPLS